MLHVTVPVVSTISSLPPCMVNVTARNWHQVVREAERFASRELHIAAPVVPYKSEHDYAVAIWREAEAKHRPIRQDLNGVQECWWKRSGAFAVGCEEPTC